MKHETQRMIETMYNKKQAIPMLMELYSKEEVIQELIANSDLPEDFCLALLAQIALHKRASVSTMIGLLSRFSSSQEIADALFHAASKDLLVWNTVLQLFIIKWELDDSVDEVIKQYKYLPPMIVPPTPLYNNKTSGYLTIKKSLLLRDNYHDEDINLEHLEKMNQQALSINVDIIKGIRNTWKGLDKCKPGESFNEYKLRVAAFESFEREAMKVLALVHNEGNECWLTHSYDKRGRTYCNG